MYNFESSVQTFMFYLIHILAVLGLVFLLLLLVKLTLWCLKCDVLDSDKPRLRSPPPPIPPPPEFMLDQKSNSEKRSTDQVIDVEVGDLHGAHDQTKSSDQKETLERGNMSTNKEPVYAKLAFDMTSVDQIKHHKCICPFCSNNQLTGPSLLQIQQVLGAKVNQTISGLDPKADLVEEFSMKCHDNQTEIQLDSALSQSLHNLSQSTSTINDNLKSKSIQSLLKSNEALYQLDQTIKEIEQLEVNVCLEHSDEKEYDVESNSEPTKETNSLAADQVATCLATEIIGQSEKVIASLKIEAEHSNHKNLSMKTDSFKFETSNQFEENIQLATTLEHQQKNANQEIFPECDQNSASIDDTANKAQSSDQKDQQRSDLSLKLPLHEPGKITPQCVIYARVIDQIKKRNSHTINE